MLKEYFIRGAHRRSIGSVMTGYSDSSGSDAPAKEADREQNSHAATEKGRSLRVTQDQAPS
jgi:hypothetical protein